jgi:hypothetical protein
LIFAALVLAYIIHGFYTDSTGPFDCFSEVKSDDQLILSNGPLPANFSQFALQNQLKRIQQSQ